MALDKFHTVSVVDGKPYPDSTVRRFDEAMRDFLCERAGEILTISGKIEQVNIMWGTPERVWATFPHKKKSEELSDKRLIPAAPNKRPTLPLMSYVRKGLALDPRYFHDKFGDRWVKVRHENGRDWYTAPKYLPIKIPYQIEFWTKYENEKLMFAETFMNRFQPDDAMPYGSSGKTATVHLVSGPDDISEIEDVGELDRVLRMTATVEVDGFLPRKPTIKKPLLRIPIYEGETVRVMNDACEEEVHIEDIQPVPEGCEPEGCGLDVVVTSETDFANLPTRCSP